MAFNKFYAVIPVVRIDYYAESRVSKISSVAIVSYYDITFKEFDSAESISAANWSMWSSYWV